MHGTIKIRWLKNSCPERLNGFRALGKAEENTDAPLHSTHWSCQHQRMMTLAFSCWGRQLGGGEQAQTASVENRAQGMGHHIAATTERMWCGHGVPEEPALPHWLCGWRHGSRALASDSLVLPSCPGCCLLFTLKQLLCLLLTEEKCSLPGSVFQLLPHTCKAGHSVTISISLCWEVGIQFTA